MIGLATVLLCGAVLWLLDFARLNWEDADRSAYCPCLRPAPGLRARWAMLRESVARMLEYPDPLSVSTCAYAFGCVAGFFAGRPYVRVPLDEYFYDSADANMYAHGCVQAASRLAKSEAGGRVCPGRARQAA